MPQITLYMDKETIRKIELAAKIEQSSVSAWVKARLCQVIESNQWPKDYFKLCGVLADTDIARPAQPTFSRDKRRTKLWTIF